MDWDHLSEIAALRKRQKLTQLQLAQMVGVTETTIANWEKGRSGLEWIDRLLRLCEALECAPEELIRYVPCAAEGLSDRRPASLSGKTFSQIRQIEKAELADTFKETLARIENEEGNLSDFLKVFQIEKAKQGWSSSPADLAPYREAEDK